MEIIKLFNEDTSEDRYARLVKLRDKLAIAIDCCESMRDLAALAKQYRETIREIEELGGVEENDDVLSIISERELNGRAGAVRKDRTKL